MCHGMITKFVASGIVFFACTVVSFGAAVADGHGKLKVSFANSIWDGKSIPSGQQCSAQSGNSPHTPELNVSGLPGGTKYIVMSITDEDAGKNGQHGIFKIQVPDNSTELTIPKIAENAVTMPPGVSVEKGEGWGMSAKGHYLPPCSNGRNHNYYADIILFDGAGKKIAGTYIDWGRY